MDFEDAVHCVTAIRNAFPIYKDDEYLDKYFGHKGCAKEASERLQAKKEKEDLAKQLLKEEADRKAEEKERLRLERESYKVAAALEKYEEQQIKRKAREEKEAGKKYAKQVEAEARLRAQQAAVAEHRGKTTFSVQGEKVACITSIIPAVCSWLKCNKSIYIVNGLLARWSESKEDVVIFNRDNFGSELAKGFSFCSTKMKWDNRTKTFEDIQTFYSICPSHILDSILATEYYHGIKELDAVLNYPTIDMNGTVHGLVKGFNTDVNMMYSGDFFYEENVELQSAYIDLFDVFKEFPHCAIPGALATMFTLITRPHIPTAPMICFDAPAEGSGKSLMAKTCLQLVCGQIPGANSQDSSDEEFDKNIKAYMQSNPGRPLLLDDFQGMIKYSILKTLLTQSGLYSFRILGTPKTCKVKTNFAVIMTGNHITLSNDLNRRSVVVSIDTGRESPADKNDYERNSSELLQFVTDNRDHLLSCLITVFLDALNNAKEEYNTRAMGSFEDWARVVGRSVKYVCSKLKEMKLLKEDIETDVTPDYKKFALLNDGMGELLHDIFNKLGPREWAIEELENYGLLNALDEVLGTDSPTESNRNRKRGSRLATKTDRPREYKERSLILRRTTNRRWRIEDAAAPLDKSYDELDKEMDKLGGGVF